MGQVSILFLFVSIFVLCEIEVSGLTGHTCSYRAPESYRTCGCFACWCKKTRYRMATKLRCCHGWKESGGSCYVPICTTSCKNGGSCVSPDTCKCAPGWTGRTCTEPICSPACGNNGKCVAPNKCRCTSRYNGTHCESPICTTSCKNGGSCVSPEFCKCARGWTGRTCIEPICSPACENNGKCVAPNKCRCTSGYNGTHCESPICRTACFNKGRCIAPEICKCDKHWTGSHCTTPVCNPPCSKGGICINPNECRYPTNLDIDKVCLKKKYDVCIVLDASSSIGEDNFQRLKKFIKSIIQNFEISTSMTHISLITFGQVPKIQFKLTDFLNQTEILDAVNNVTFSGGATSTSDALEMMRTDGFAGEHPDAPDVGVLITDGLSKFPRITQVQADLAKQEGITMLAIGVGQDASHSELFGISSGLSYVFEVADFKALLAINEDVARTICQVELPKHYTSRTTTTETSSVAVDKCRDTTNCTDYARDMCFDYEDWARAHCPRTCGFCGTTETIVECKNNIDECEQYGQHMCLNSKYYSWVERNCAEYCGFCGNKTDEVIVPTPEVSTVKVPSVCTDQIRNCDEYGGPSVCTDPSYASWTKSHCPKYCGICYKIQHYDAKDVGKLRCPAWDLPEECTLSYNGGSCCPIPVCPSNLRLTVRRL